MDWKLALTGVKGVHLGYENNNPAYQILLSSTKKVVITHHAMFNEKCFPILAGSHSPIARFSWGASRTKPEVVDETHPGCPGVVDGVHSGQTEVVDETHSVMTLHCDH
ncbi:hypothetical protein O181_005782 [Austropuccinia psidii MF-1]|uniref:Retroviral polymerase SH3-like domain-containing protein n=1 Tax=Austropuccinia psidii MF-1 TaxID=1389203 RepID=A0A9Q3BJF1_9BASI|nr:hypothetical protein [Austropuccinia psidii MF-1]